MRHVILTCKNHPNLRWSCKEEAFSGDGYGYNGARRIFFNGQTPGRRYGDASGFKFNERACECSCDAKELIRAPEDKYVRIGDGPIPELPAEYDQTPGSPFH